MKLKLHKRKNKNKTILSILFVTLVFMGIGYAYIQSQLILGGNVTAKKAKWNVQINNLTIDTDSVATKDSIKLIDNKIEIHFMANLKNKTDVYRFNFDIENKGSTNAKVDSINIGGLSTEDKDNIDYLVTYSNGESISKNDILKSNETTNIVVYVKHKLDSEKTSGIYNLSFKIKYTSTTENPSDIKLLSNIISTNANKNPTVNFKAISPTSDTDLNGQGLNLLKSTETDEYPVYYYRGNVTNNNIIFNNICWKIIRTTETGGTKIIYNGLAIDNKCQNIEDDTIAFDSAFNSTKDSILKVGYMYQDKYNYKAYLNTATNADSYLYGSDYTYDSATKNYTITNTISSVATNTDLTTHHYSCGNSTTTCQTLRYIFCTSDPKEDGTYSFYYIELTNGESIDNVFEKLTINETESTIKTQLENWFAENLFDKITYLEDTVWCNSRIVNNLGGWDPKNNILSSSSWLKFNEQINNTNTNISCQKAEDKFTVAESIGNGKNYYPIGIITENEAILAGGALYQDNTKYYLYNNKDWYTMTPSRFTDGYADIYYIRTAGSIASQRVDTVLGERPVISLNKNVRIKSGDGSTDNPYIVK